MQMEIKRFGNPAGKTIMLLHGNLMCWRQFEDVIPLLAKEYLVFAVSFDGTGKTTYTNAQDQADKLAEYVVENCGGSLDLVFAEPLGLNLYRTKLPVREDVKAACWYGEKEGHMKKAIEKLRRFYPRLTIRRFEGYGHGDIMNHPEQLTSELIHFWGQ